MDSQNIMFHKIWTICNYWYWVYAAMVAMEGTLLSLIIIEQQGEDEHKQEESRHSESNLFNAVLRHARAEPKAP